MISKLIRIAS